MGIVRQAREVTQDPPNARRNGEREVERERQAGEVNQDPPNARRNGEREVERERQATEASDAT